MIVLYYGIRRKEAKIKLSEPEMAEITLNKELKKIIDDIAEVAGYLWKRGWAVGSAGNISVDVTELISQKGKNFRRFPKIPLKVAESELSRRCFLVTATGSRFRELAREPKGSLLLVSIAGRLDGYSCLWGGKGPESRPTSELLAHLKIHGFLRRNNCPQKVVLHTHPSHLIALTHLKDYGQDSFNRFLWSTHVGTKLFLPKGVGMAPYCREGSEELAEVTVNLLKNHRAVLWEKHGCVTIGADVFEAFDLTDILEQEAEIFFICKGAGYEPEGLSREQRAELKRRPGQ